MNTQDDALIPKPGVTLFHLNFTNGPRMVIQTLKPKAGTQGGGRGGGDSHPQIQEV